MQMMDPNEIKRYKQLHKNIIKNGGQPDFDMETLEEDLVSAKEQAAQLIAEGYIRTSTKYCGLTKLPPDHPPGGGFGGVHITVSRAVFEAFKKLGGLTLSEHLAIPGLQSDIEKTSRLLVRHGLPIRILSNEELKNMSFKTLCNIRTWLEWPENLAMPEELKICL